jgi:oxygen-independent coproporphyrinogen-3 oxidase
MRLAEVLTEAPYQGYSYGYPHKTAYRPLRPAVTLRAAWAAEPRDALFLYLHVPFCEMRCGFCNLFTQARPKDDLVTSYLAALRRQAMQVRAALGMARFARCAIGGGTPTFLNAGQLDTLFDIAEEVLGAPPADLPVSLEVSPETIDAEKLALLRERGVERLSIGIQSFREAETSAVGRPQPAATVRRALELLQPADFPTLNLDLIYGLPGQTADSWLASLEAALAYSPQELYLYPLYVRPLTGLGKSERCWDDLRLDCYRSGRACLLARGWRQVSMRMFQAPNAPASTGPVYCCQEDGMVGLGCGARSYTRELHYSTEYAVGMRGVREIVADFIGRPDAAFAQANYGFLLDDEEQRRRYVIQSLLTHVGLDVPAYQRRFHSDPLDDLPQLLELESLGLANRQGQHLILTAAGLERSDAIGPWLYSQRVQALMAGYEHR